MGFEVPRSGEPSQLRSDDEQREAVGVRRALQNLSGLVVTQVQQTVLIDRQ